MNENLKLAVISTLAEEHLLSLDAPELDALVQSAARGFETVTESEKSVKVYHGNFSQIKNFFINLDLSPELLSQMKVLRWSMESLLIREFLWAGLAENKEIFAIDSLAGVEQMPGLLRLDLMVVELPDLLPITKLSQIEEVRLDSEQEFSLKIFLNLTKLRFLGILPQCDRQNQTLAIDLLQRGVYLSRRLWKLLYNLDTELFFSSIETALAQGSVADVRAEIFYMREEYESEFRDLQALAQAHYVHNDLHRRLALNLLNRGLFSEALLELKKYEQKELASQKSVHDLLAYSYLMLGEDLLALRENLLSDLTEIERDFDLDNSDILENVSLREGLSVIHDLRRDFPGQEILWSVELELLDRHEKSEEMLTILDDAFAQYPNSAYFLYMAAEAHNRLNQYEQAVRYYEEAIAKDDGTLLVPVIQNQLADLHSRYGYFQQAMLVIQEALEADPDGDFAVAYVTAAEIAVALNDKKSFYEYLEKALDSDFYETVDDVMDNEIFQKFSKEKSFQDLLKKYF